MIELQVIQKFLQYGSPDQRLQIADVLKGQVGGVAGSSEECRAWGSGAAISPQSWHWTWQDVLAQSYRQPPVLSTSLSTCLTHMDLQSASTTLCACVEAAPIPVFLLLH